MGHLARARRVGREGNVVGRVVATGNGELERCAAVDRVGDGRFNRLGDREVAGRVGGGDHGISVCFERDGLGVEGRRELRIGSLGDGARSADRQVLDAVVGFANDGERADRVVDGEVGVIADDGEVEAEVCRIEIGRESLDLLGDDEVGHESLVYEARRCWCGRIDQDIDGGI